MARPPETFEQLLDAGDRRYGEGDHDGALDLYERSLRLAPDAGARAEAFCAIGDALLAVGRIEEAVAMFQKAVDLDPDGPGGWCGEADVAYERWELSRALQLAREALARDADCARAHYLTGLVHEKRGDDAAASRSFRRAARIDPDYYPVPRELPEEDFRRLVDEALASVPAAIQELLSDVDVELRALPPLRDAAMYREHHIGPQVPGLVLESDELGSGGVPRLTLVLYRRNLEKLASSSEALLEEIRKTVVEELDPELDLPDAGGLVHAAGDASPPGR